MNSITTLIKTNNEVMVINVFVDFTKTFDLYNMTSWGFLTVVLFARENM